MPLKLELTKAQINCIINLYTVKKLSCREIAQTTGFAAASSIRNILGENNVKFRPSGTYHHERKTNMVCGHLDKPHRALGMCINCHNRHRIKSQKKTECECGLPVIARGMCSNCYSAWRYQTILKRKQHQKKPEPLVCGRCGTQTFLEHSKNRQKCFKCRWTDDGKY